MEKDGEEVVCARHGGQIGRVISVEICHHKCQHAVQRITDDERSWVESRWGPRVGIPRQRVVFPRGGNKIQICVVVEVDKEKSVDSVAGRGESCRRSGESIVGRVEKDADGIVVKGSNHKVWEGIVVHVAPRHCAGRERGG